MSPGRKPGRELGQHGVDLITQLHSAAEAGERVWVEDSSLGRLGVCMWGDGEGVRQTIICQKTCTAAG